jgi:Aspartyl protease
MRAVIPIVIASLIACALVPRYASQMARPPSAAVVVAAAHPDPAAAQSNNAATRSVVIAPSRGGHFRVTGRVDGRRMDFMVDTGASLIALKPEDAALLGIRPIASDYVAPVKTAPGGAGRTPHGRDRGSRSAQRRSDGAAGGRCAGKPARPVVLEAAAAVRICRRHAHFATIAAFLFATIPSADRLGYAVRPSSTIHPSFHVSQAEAVA